MAVRRESVVLSLDDRFSSGVIKAAGATQLLEQRLKGLDGTSVRTGTSVDRTTTSVDQQSSVFRKASPEIDRYSGRLRLLGDAVAILGPGLAPIATATIPAIAGLSSALGFAALATGTVMAGFQGVGDALGAVNKAQLEPTAKNLEAARLAMEQLSPAAQRIVGDLDRLGPALTMLRDASAGGMAPGVERSADALLVLLPKLRGFFADTAAAASDFAADSLESLNTERWAPFLTFLEREAPSAVSSLGQSTGDLAHGLAELWMAFDPLNDDVLGILERGAAGFDNWASSLAQTDGFREFVDYVRATAPQVGETIVSIADALLQIGEAAAPFGGPVLAGLEGFARIVGSIADSDLGTPIIAGIAALSAYNRVMAVTASLQTKMQAGGGLAGMVAGPVGGAKSSLKAVAADVSTLGAAWATAGASTSREQARIAATTKSLGSNIRSLAGSAGRVAGPVAGVALATSGLADKFGLANTASLALIGSMGGPWGAAAGAAVGATMDLVAANDDLESSLGRLQQSSAGSSYADLLTNLQSVRTEAEGFGDTWKTVDNIVKMVPIAGTWASAGLGKVMGDDAEAAAEAEAAARRTASAYESLGLALGAPGLQVDIPLLGKTTIANGDQLAATLERAAPALQALGYSGADLTGLERIPGLMTLVGAQVEGYVQHSESAAGRTEALSGAINGLSEVALPAAEAANALQTALDNLLSPSLNAEAATDAWRESLAQLRNELKAGAGFNEFTEAGRANQAMTRDYVEDSKSRLVALAGVATTTEGQMAKAVSETRAEFIASGIAAGFSREQITRRANEMGLTPKMVRTVFQAAGIDESVLKLREARAAMTELPKSVQTEIRANGIPQTMGEINKLTNRLDLTEKQRQALITLRDLASKGIELVDGKLRRVDGTNAKPSVGLVDAAFNATERKIQAALRVLNGTNVRPTAGLNDQASGPANSIRAAINSIPEWKSSTITVTTIRQTINRVSNVVSGAVSGLFGNKGLFLPEVRHYAGGGMDRANGHQPEFAGPGPSRVWREPETGGESYIPHADDHRRPRAMSILEQTAALFGGQVEYYAQGGSNGPRMGDNRGRGDGPGSRAARALRELERASDGAKKALQREVKQRDALIEKRNEYASSLTNSVRSSLFEASTSPWAASAAGDPRAVLKQDIAEANELEQLLKRLRSRGLDGQAYKTVDSLDAARTLGSFSKAELRNFEQLFRRRQRATAAAGAVGGAAVYGADIKGVRRDIGRLRNAVERLDKNNQKGHRDNARDVTKGINGGAASANRRAGRRL